MAFVVTNVLFSLVVNAMFFNVLLCNLADKKLLVSSKKVDLIFHVGSMIFFKKSDTTGKTNYRPISTQISQKFLKK